MHSVWAEASFWISAVPIKRAGTPKLVIILSDIQFSSESIFGCGVGMQLSGYPDTLNF
jgi:hypothetical protein